MKDIMFESNNTFFNGVVVLFFLITTNLFSQQDPQITHNMFNKFMYNPAVAGAYPELHATLLHRNKWVDLISFTNFDIP